MPHGYIKRILNAQVYDVAQETPLEPAARLSERLGNRVLFKREDLQPVFSFKCRGAYNKLFQLCRSGEPPAGVIASSAGNHAQGVALAARRLGLKALIIMPKTTPSIKVDAVKALGAEPILYGDAYDDAYQHAVTLAEREGLTFVHPFDDPDVIAGQGTVAQELLHQHSGALDAVFIPVGGGGLMAGMSAYIKYLRPEIKVIGVEPVDAPSLHHALRAGERVRLDSVGLFADGVAVRQVGEENWRIMRETVDDVVLVEVDEICAAIKDVFDDTRSIAEPAGALSVAGLKRYVETTGARHQTLAAMICGANMNFDRLRHVSERAELGEQREMLLAVTIPEQPGSFRTFCEAVGRRGVTEFNYRYADDREAHIFVGIKLESRAERRDIIARLKQHGYPVHDMTDNEMAKLHIRHMVGGYGSGIPRETIYRFEFPERPGALLDFLNAMDLRWNISLFHYRNHGAAYGRVLAGFQVPDEHAERFRNFLEGLNYPYWDETGNIAYALFLGSHSDNYAVAGQD